MTAADRAALDLRRRERIEKHWPRWRWTPEGLSRWDSFDARYYLSVLGVALLLATGFIEVALLSGESPLLSPIQALGSHPWIALILAAVSGWVLHRILVWKCRGSARLPLERRILRAVIAAVPVGGLLALPYWRASANERPAPDSVAPSLALDRLPKWGLRRLGLDLWLHRHAQRLPWILAWMFAGQLIPWFTLVAWATRPAVLRNHFGLQIALLLPMHVATAVCLLLYTRREVAARQLTGLRAHLLTWLPLTFLLPLPMNLVGAHIWRRRSFESLGKKSLFETIAAGPRTSTLRMAGSTEGGGEVGAHDRFWRRFTELKTALLAADGALLGALLAHRKIEILEPWSFVLLYSAFAALAIGPILAAGRFVPWGFSRWHRTDAPVRPPIPFAISVGPAAFGLGGFLGWRFVALGATKAGGMLAAIAPAIVVLVVAAFLSLFLAQLTKRTLDLAFGRGILWLVGLQFLAVVGLLVSAGLPGAAPLLAGTILASPLAHLVLGGRALPWLLHPLGWKGVFDRLLAGSLRWNLAGRAATALLPFGGLFLPFWLHHRSRRARRDGRTWWKVAGRLMP